mmetsp:Transcript_38820/g.97799  ORF Transcript_38820/g.97799 Transcript_38820/m.97799 type:complete len:192 (+) Transcript_38820:108-683(+)|eukprot:CAMPEP_0174240492 /NCGR_PEP_ID=MMETSP0417-20130205/19072_1 /TAXON_ID=242541 /ORGANISM="Mayorella sp, Strain BSH-02190019" /LENGTH=191 /DNA_ID=CAMNT_0015319589 /DNA_START=45 /DNA_END=620 /DNA_ORIENTATION=+
MDTLFPDQPEGLPTNTLEEPVTATLLRDFKMVCYKTFHVLVPTGRGHEVLRDWDLWGPLLFCFTLAIFMSMSAPKDSSALVFTACFVIIWLGALVITLNAKLLGGKVSFFQSLSVIGYCLLPLAVASIAIFFYRNIIFRLVLGGAALVWSTWASVGFYRTMVPERRQVLNLYPIFLFYITLAWIVILPNSK